MIRMVGGQKAEGFAKTQQGKAIASAPVVWRRATVPEQTVVLLRACGQEETRQQIEIAPLTREPEGPTEHCTVHEHVFGAVIWIRGRWRAFISAGTIAFCHAENHVRIAAIARDFKKLHTPDQASQGRWSGRYVKHPHL